MTHYCLASLDFQLRKILQDKDIVVHSDPEIKGPRFESRRSCKTCRHGINKVFTFVHFDVFIFQRKKIASQILKQKIKSRNLAPFSKTKNEKVLVLLIWSEPGCCSWHEKATLGASPGVLNAAMELESRGDTNNWPFKMLKCSFYLDTTAVQWM